MRIIFLRKKLVEVRPEVMEEGFSVFHGTNLLALYRILKSGKLGSSVGRHGGAFERVGYFYTTTSFDWAYRYAQETANSKHFFLPEEEATPELLEDLIEIPSSEISIDKIAEALGTNDLEEIYTIVASIARYTLGAEIPPVIIGITITPENTEVLGKFYIDEDDFRDWLKGQDTEYILQVARRDPQFEQFIRERVGDPDRIKTEEDLIDYAREDVEHLALETFSEVEEVDEEDIFHAAYHLVAKEIYLALLRLAEEKNDPEAKQILKTAAEEFPATSFYLIEPTPLEKIDAAYADIFMPDGSVKRINLHDENATAQVEEIMKQQVIRWVRAIIG